MKRALFKSFLITCSGSLKGVISDCKGNELTPAKASSSVEAGMPHCFFTDCFSMVRFGTSESQGMHVKGEQFLNRL